jgi:hypothetical protein
MTMSHAPRRSRLQLLALAAVLGFALVGLAQCRNVADRMTGVELRAPGTLSIRSSCTRWCNSEFKAAVLAEEARFRAARRACSFSHSCRKDADRIHAQNLRRILDDLHRCKHSCYNEGAGNSGA